MKLLKPTFALQISHPATVRGNVSTCGLEAYGVMVLLCWKSNSFVQALWFMLWTMCGLVTEKKWKYHWAQHNVKQYSDFLSYCSSYYGWRLWTYVLTSHFQPDHGRGWASGVCGHTGILSSIQFLNPSDLQCSTMDILFCKWHRPQIKISWWQMVYKSKKDNVLKAKSTWKLLVLLHLHSYHQIELNVVVFA